ncbi:hypothetical protein JCM10908_006422 [Rhodotorula pacifica]|uniref:uncharacterized protein n=1 Tax=Rhodotorula pacifica TaxID=1495444 RepID=UPI00317C27DE
MTTTYAQQPAQQSSSLSSANTAEAAAAETSTSSRSQRKERQTRLQEHLRSVKPGSRSASPSGINGNTSSKQATGQKFSAAAATSMGRASSRKSAAPAARKAAAVAAATAGDVEPTDAVQEVSATGRPKRRAAKARVVLADLESSGEETDAASKQEAETNNNETEQAEEAIAALPSRRTAGNKARGQARQPIPPLRQASIDDLAPSATRPSSSSSTTATAARNSVGRKSPAKQVQTSQQQRRKREASGGSATSVGQRSSAQPSPSPYHTDTNLMQKHQFRSVLAQHGFNPEEEVLERAMQTISNSRQELTVDTFLRVLRALDANVSPLKRTSNPQLSVSVSRSNATGSSKRGGFSALKSPSTPSSMAADGRFLPSPPLSQSPAARPLASSYSLAGVYRQAPPPPASDSLPVPPPSAGLVPPSRPTLFTSRSISAPSLPTLDSTLMSQASMPAVPAPFPQQEMSATQQHQQPTATTSPVGGLFATSVAGMGRVALSRRSMFGQLGSAPSPTAAMTSFAEPASSTAFSHLSPPAANATSPPSNGTLSSAGNGLLPAFALGAAASTVAQKTTRSRASSISKSSSPVKPADDARLAKLRSWLDDDEDTTEEEEVKTGADAPAEAEASLKASTANGKLAGRLTAFSGVLGALDEQPEPAVQEVKVDLVRAPEETRVGGKNISVLRQSQKRQLDDVATPEPDSSNVKMTTRASTRASSKGKGKAVHYCLCDEDADDQPRTIECTACEATYHLACLNATSARQLPAPFVCTRCTIITPPAEPPLAAGQRTPELANKRVRIGTTSTPHLLSEPTFVASTPLSAPRGDAFGPLVADLALAPSPTASPVRRFARAPVSPVHQRAQLPIPTTPHFGDALTRGPGDYSPTSPQNTRTRAARTRLVSNAGAAFFGGAGGGEWLESWDQHQFPVADSMQAQPPSSTMSSLAEDDWRLPSWSDVNMTPSRALSSATPATSASSSVWDTPYAHSSPQARRMHSGGGQGPYLLSHHTRTPSQDLMTMLDREQASSPTHHSEPAHHTFSQRLFGGHGSAFDSPTFDSHGNVPHSMPLGHHPPSPLNPRRQPSYGHARKQSLGDGLGRAPFAYPLSPAHAHPYLPSHMHGLGSVGMKPSFSAPGGRLVDLMPSLNYEEQQQLDDLLV